MPWNMDNIAWNIVYITVLRHPLFLVVYKQYNKKRILELKIGGLPNLKLSKINIV